MIVVILQGLSSLCGLVSLVCFIMVLVQMFKRGETTMGIVCIVTLFCCIGGRRWWLFLLGMIQRAGLAAGAQQ